MPVASKGPFVEQTNDRPLKTKAPDPSQNLNSVVVLSESLPSDVSRVVSQFEIMDG